MPSKKGLGAGFNVNTDIDSLHVDKQATTLSKWVFWLGVAGMWFMFIPSIISLLLVKKAKAELHTQTEKNHSLKMISWGRGLSWAGIILNIISAVFIYFALTYSTGLFEQACFQNEYFCQFVF